MAPFWANAPKEITLIPTSDKNLQKLGGKISDISSRIDFSEAKYFVGTEQDSLVFLPTHWTEVKAMEGYTPALGIATLIHFTRKQFAGFKGVVKEVTPKDLFFTTALSKLMESGKTYSGFIDTSIPDSVLNKLQELQAKIDDASQVATKPQNEMMVQMMVESYVNVVEVPTPSETLAQIAIAESRSFGGGSYGGGSKSEAESDKIKAREAAITAILIKLTGSEDPTVHKNAMCDQNFIILASLTLGLPVPSNLSLSF
jgi:hypothetical protein